MAMVSVPEVSQYSRVGRDSLEGTVEHVHLNTYRFLRYHGWHEDAISTASSLIIRATEGLLCLEENEIYVEVILYHPIFGSS